MPIPDPWSEQKKTDEADESSTNRVHEPEPAHERARGYQESTPDSGHGEVVPFPGAPAEVTDSDEPPRASEKWRTAASVWGQEAQDTARAALDGSVWRARPPSLRDIHARIVRADWAGNIRWLYLPGLVFGHVSLLITALGYALLWLARRPSRLTIAALITVLIVVWAI